MAEGVFHRTSGKSKAFMLHIRLDSGSSPGMTPTPLSPPCISACSITRTGLVKGRHSANDRIFSNVHWILMIH